MCIRDSAGWCCAGWPSTSSSSELFGETASAVLAWLWLTAGRRDPEDGMVGGIGQPSEVPVHVAAGALAVGGDDGRPLRHRQFGRPERLRLGPVSYTHLTLPTKRIV